MKKIWIFIFFGVLLSSCSSRSELKGNRVLVQFRDTIPHEYYLLSVRDSSLVVKPGYYDLPGEPIVIPFSRISRVMHDVHGKLTGALLGGAIGGVAAFGTVFVIAKSQPQIQGNQGMAFAGLAAIIGASAVTLGIIIGNGLSEGEKGYSISSAHDRDVLRDYSQYPDTEPPELQKLK
jgi:hypothetical protein